MEWLFWLRNLMVLAQFCAIVVSVKFMGISLPVLQIGMAPLLLISFNLLVYWRLENGRSVSEFEIILQLLFDMLVFTWLLYWTGGSANPFVSAYLVPVAAAAAFGSFRYAVILGLVSVALYSFLMIAYVPLPSMNGRFGGDFSLHIFGMWLSFLLSAAITIAVVSGLARLARRREIALKQAEQESINSQHLITLGALAAGAAHELGTPLSNISMLADELATSEGDEQERAELVYSLKEQLGLCQSQIGLLRDQATHAQNPEVRIGSVGQFLNGRGDRVRPGPVSSLAQCTQ
jgi:two-component system sensor histidine kinase RegB